MLPICEMLHKAEPFASLQNTCAYLDSDVTETGIASIAAIYSGHYVGGNYLHDSQLTEDR